MTTQQPGSRIPDYEPADFPPRGHRHPLNVVPVEPAGPNRQAQQTPAQPGARPLRSWRDRETGRTALFGVATAVLVTTVLLVLLVVWLIAVL